MSKSSQRTGGQILVDQLRIHGVERAFCVPGESYLALLDALYDAPDIALMVCRHESGAAMMADAYGKLTGRPGVCLVTRGPGATNASAGVHIAYQDSTPMILLVGQVARDTVDREAFQEIDFRRMYAQLAKWVAQIDDPKRIPEYLSRAFYTATAGRQGPVVLALPEDMLAEEARAVDAQPFERVQAHPGVEELARLRELLSQSERPLIVLGGSGWTAEACEDIKAFAELNALPVSVSFRCQHLFDNTHRNYVGDIGIGVNPKLAQRVRESDLLIVVGARLGEMTTSGYTLIDIPVPRQQLVHVYSGAEELGRVYQPRLAIAASMSAFAANARALEPVDSATWKAHTEEARNDYLANIEPTHGPGDLQLADVVFWLRGHLPRDAIVTNGAGNYTAWVHRFYQYRSFGSQIAPTSGSMGYGVPAAIAAKAQYPERTVVSFAGDGCFLMTGQELATAVMYGLNIVILVVNNHMYGTIRMHQEREYPGRVIATDLVNPDFVALAHAYGAHGELVERTEDFPAAFERALAAGKPALLELRVEPEAITPGTTLSELRDSRGQR
ncbi:MAG: thiamine pyrophosphate-binding protein [Acidiferrobacterales bacterium]